MHTLTHRLARLMVAGALLAALILAVSHGLEKGTGWHIKVALVIGLACVAIGEFLSWHNAADAWHERRAGAMSLWIALGAVLTAGTLYTNFASSAGNNEAKAGVQKAAYVAQSDTSSTIDELMARKRRLEQRMTMKPVRDPEAARQAQIAAKGDPRWKLTAGCTDIKGERTRAWCSEYASAIADEKLGTELITVGAELKAVEKDLAALRHQRSERPAVVSDDQPAVTVLARLLAVDATVARQADSMILPILVQAMLLFGGICLAVERHRDRPRTPWIDWPKWGRRWRLLTQAPTHHDPDPEPASARFLKLYARECEKVGVRNLVAA